MSCVRGNSHAQFLEGWTGAIPSGYSVQTVPEPDAGHRESNRDGGPDAGKRPIPGLLPGDDLRRLPRRSQFGQPESRNPVVFDDEVLQVSAAPASASVPAGRPSRGIMNSIRPKQRRLRLDAEAYQQLCHQVLQRDGGCQACGSMQHLQVHHKQFRSHSGDDSKENLIALCERCHNLVHDNRNHREN